MNTDRTKPAAWHQVMIGLTGARLRLYDEMLTNGAAALPSTPEEAAAAQWLHRHQFAWFDGADQALRPRTTAKARDHWECHGPAADIAALTATEEPVTPPESGTETTPARPVVHAGQIEVFSMEGYW